MAATGKTLVQPRVGADQGLVPDRSGFLDQLTAFSNVALVKLRGIPGCAKISDRRV
jgi:hypothetical protein